MLSELERDSDEDVSRNTENAEFPFQEQWHFEKFDIKHRNTESKEEVKQHLILLKKKRYC